MNAEQVVNKIITEANAQADKIRSEAQEKVEADKSKLDSELKEYRARTETLAAEAGEDKRARMLAAARMENRKANLAAQVKLLDSVFTGAADRINSLETAQYQKLMGQFMTKSVETGDEKVIVGKNETRIDNSLIKNVNRELGPGFRGNIQLADQKADIKGGFILKRGNIQVNVSTEVLVQQVREELEMEIAQELFG